MLFKSCNCNSSIATRVGFAVCISVIPATSFSNENIDHILSEFYIGMDHENRHGHKAYSEVEP